MNLENITKLLFIFTGLVIVMTSCKTKKGQWGSLIKNDLSNWVQLNGPATFELKDGVIKNNKLQLHGIV